MINDEVKKMNLKECILNSHPALDQAAIFYLGQEGMLVKYQGKYLFFDPYLSDYVDRNCCSENVIWRRNYPAPIDPAALDFIDYVFCSHDHADHADPDTLTALAKASPNARFIGGKPVQRVFEKCGIAADRLICARADEEIFLEENISVLPIPAAHEEIIRDEEGNCQALGFLATLGKIRFYHAGDCCVYDGLAQRIQGADIACLPINGRDYYRLRDDIIGNMDCQEAARLAREAQIALTIPMHYDLYPINCLNPGWFVESMARFAPGQSFHLFQPGEKFLFEKNEK